MAEMAEQVQDVMRDEGRTMSELVQMKYRRQAIDMNVSRLH